MGNVYVSKATIEFLRDQSLQWIEAIAESDEERHVIRALAEKESHLYPLAVRFEPALLKQDWYRKACESKGFDPDNPWNACSYGLVQVLFVTALDYDGDLPSARELLSEPRHALWCGVEHLRKLRRRFTLYSALSAYNAGRPVNSNRESYVLPILRRIEELEAGE